MAQKFPVPPFPSAGELVYEVCIRSGLVPTNDKDPLYNELKSFKDERKRPALRPIRFPKHVWVDVEKRLAGLIKSDMHALLIFKAGRQFLESYGALIVTTDATLFSREQFEESVLWPSTFASMTAVFLKVFSRIFPGVDAKELLSNPTPLAFHLRTICKNDVDDYKMICHFRAEKYNIQPDNCRTTLDEWLKGEAVPRLESCQDVLDAMDLGDDTSSLVWMLTARLLSKTAPHHREQILYHLKPENGLPKSHELFRELTRNAGWELGKKLNIGPDRPYGKLREALFNPTVPRDGAAVEDMIARQVKTWEPIAEHTMHEIEWFRGRYLVLCGKPEQAYEHYLTAYNLGAGRDPNVYREVIDEALALAGKLGNKKGIRRFSELLYMHWTTEWDGEEASLPEHFERKFPKSLHYPVCTSM